MLALAATGLFLASFALAAGTIAYMVGQYGNRALAALWMEHVPAHAIAHADLSYRRIRPTRPQVSASISVSRLRVLERRTAA